MLHSAADKAAHKALAERDLPTFEGLLEKRKVTCDAPMLTRAAMQWGDPRVVTLVGGYFTDHALTWALNDAMEARQDARAQILLDAANKRPRPYGKPVLDLHQALYDATRSGQMTALKGLLLRGATLEGMTRLRLNPVDAAAHANRVAMLDHWLPQCPGQKIRDEALYQAAEGRAREAFLRLWPEATSTGQNLAVSNVAMAMLRRGDQDLANLLDATLSLLSSGNALPCAFPEALTRVFISAVAEHDWEKAARQVPWLAPDDDDARALRLAVENQRPELVAALLPRTDVSLARKAWTQERPPRWDLVDALAAQASPELRQSWLADKKNTDRLPQALAVARQDQAMKADLGPARPRPRRRS